MTDHDPESVPSKTAVKKALLALQELADRLTGLPQAQLDKLSLDERLLDGIRMAQGMKRDSARKRQIQYLAKQLRNLNTDALRTRLADLQAGSAQEQRNFRALEHWRQRLLDEPAALTEYVDAHPGVDAQTLRTLLRQARKERQHDQPPAAWRRLFRFLRDTSPDASD